MIEASARSAWTGLDAKLRPFIARRVRSDADVADVLQDVFLRMHRGLSALRDDERMGPWVYQVARSAIADHHRARARQPLANDDPPEVAAPEPNEAEENTAEKDLAMYVAAFVAMLPSPYRETLTLTELEGVSQKEAAEMLGITLAATKSRVLRGRQQLREALEACCEIALDGRGRVMSCEPKPDGPIPGCRCR